MVGAEGSEIGCQPSAASRSELVGVKPQPESGLPAHREAMFRGDHINSTEDRAVLYTALRAPRGTQVVVDGVDVVPAVREVLERMAVFAEQVRDGSCAAQPGTDTIRP